MARTKAERIVRVRNMVTDGARHAREAQVASLESIGEGGVHWSTLSDLIDTQARRTVYEYLDKAFEAVADPKLPFAVGNLIEQADLRAQIATTDAFNTGTNDAANLLNRAVAAAWLRVWSDQNFGLRSKLTD